jgi:hypothetical protein
MQSCSLGYLTLAKVKKLKLSSLLTLNIEHDHDDSMYEKPELFNPRQRTLVIMKDICEKLKLLNPRCKNILINEGLPTPDYGNMVMGTMASGNITFLLLVGKA